MAIGGAIIEHSLSHMRNVLQHHKFTCSLDDVSDDMVMISVQGPRRSQNNFLHLRLGSAKYVEILFFINVKKTAV